MKRTGNVVSAIGAAAFLALALSSCNLLFEPTATAEYLGGPIAIGGTVSTSAEIFEIGEVTGIVEVRLGDLTYADAGNLEVVLESPGGRQVHLLNRQGGLSDFAGPGWDYVFVDSGDEDGLPHLVTWEGEVVPETYQAYGDLGDFEGGDARGEWQLRIRSFSGGGSLGSWSLALHYKEYE